MASAQLLIDEAFEDLPNMPVLAQAKQQLTQCAQSLANFREMVFDIKEQRIRAVAVATIIDALLEHMTLNYPDIILTLNRCQRLHAHNEVIEPYSINADASLLPAILNLINNAVRATRDEKSNRVVLNEQISTTHWALSIRYFGTGFTQHELDILGTLPVESAQGFGMAVLLSHAILERLKGTLVIENHRDSGALVTVSFPLNK